MASCPTCACAFVISKRAARAIANGSNCDRIWPLTRSDRVAGAYSFSVCQVWFAAGMTSVSNRSENGLHFCGNPKVHSRKSCRIGHSRARGTPAAENWTSVRLARRALLHTALRPRSGCKCPSAPQRGPHPLLLRSRLVVPGAVGRARLRRKAAAIIP
jgi:hypothetical protein